MDKTEPKNYSGRTPLVTSFLPSTSSFQRLPIGSVLLPQFSCLLQVNYHDQIDSHFYEVSGIATHTPHVPAHARLLAEDTCKESVSQRKKNGLCRCSPEVVQT